MQCIEPIQSKNPALLFLKIKRSSIQVVFDVSFQRVLPSFLRVVPYFHRYIIV